MKYEEYVIGDTYKSKSLKVTKEEIMQFASEFDPQYMHIDEEEANKSRFGGIIASGVHTIAISVKLWVEEGIFGKNVIAGAGMDKIKFIKPVYPNDELHIIGEIIGKKTTKKESGIITVKISTYNQHDELIFSGELPVLLKRSKSAGN